MAKIAASARAFALAGCLVFMSAGLERSVHAAPPTGHAAAAIEFDIAAQPLKQALAHYDALTALSVFFPSDLLAGRTSTAVQGWYVPQDALRRLLEGTGLTIRSTAADAFVLVPGEPGSSGPGTAGPAEPTGARGYDALLQSGVLAALCAHGDLHLGEYRLALRIQMAPSGRVAQARLLDTTGDKARDAAILAALRQVRIGEPPANADKPFVLLVRPSADAARACPPTVH